MGRPTIPLGQRIDRYTSRQSNGCWIWVGAVGKHGYGIIDVGGRTMRAHRAVYEFMRGPIPEGLTIDHLCRETRCVNPDHCEPVTIQENLRRRDALVTHCWRGHEFTKANTIMHKGARNCRECGRIAARNYQQRKRANH